MLGSLVGKELLTSRKPDQKSLIFIYWLKNLLENLYPDSGEIGRKMASNGFYSYRNHYYRLIVFDGKYWNTLRVNRRSDWVLHLQIENFIQSSIRIYWRISHENWGRLSSSGRLQVESIAWK